MKITLLILAAATMFGLAAETVPFPFELNGKMMPAGTYIAQGAGYRHVLRISEARTGRTFYAGGALTEASRRTLLNFARYGDSYVLVSVTNNGETMPMPTSRKVKETAKAKGVAETLSVAAGQ